MQKKDFNNLGPVLAEEKKKNLDRSRHPFFSKSYKTTDKSTSICQENYELNISYAL